MKVLTVLSSRGGNSKTITSLFIAVAAAQNGLRTILVDGDFEAPSLIHLLPKTDFKVTWMEYLDNKQTQISSAICKTEIPNLDVIFSPPPHVGYSFLDWRNDKWWKSALKRSLEASIELEKNGYDLMVVDSQSGTSYNSLNNLALADLSIMVLRPAGYGLGATEGMLREIISTLKGMKERKDYFLWTQVYQGSNEEEILQTERFFEKWNSKLENLGLKILGKIPYNNELNLSLMNDRFDFKNLDSEVYKMYEEVYKKIFES